VTGGIFRVEGVLPGPAAVSLLATNDLRVLYRSQFDLPGPGGAPLVEIPVTPVTLPVTPATPVTLPVTPATPVTAPAPTAGAETLARPPTGDPAP
jgi:hypothetical protein